MRLRSAALAWLALALAGCVSARATRYPYFLAERGVSGAAAQRWALAPSALPEYLEGAGQGLDAEICARIERAGHVCTRLPSTEVAEQASGFDAVVFPAVVARAVAVLPGAWVVWDGVKRRARIVREEGAPMGVYQMAGSVWVLSLHVRVSGSDATRLFENQVGLELLHEARVDASSYQKHLRADLLADPESLRESVERVLHPLLGG